MDTKLGAVSRTSRHAETLRAPESSRFKCLSTLRNLDEEAVNEESTEVMKREEKKKPPSRLEMLLKWKKEKQIKKAMDNKKKPFYVGGQLGKSNSNMGVSSVAQNNVSFHSSRIAKSRLAPPSSTHPAKIINTTKQVSSLPKPSFTKQPNKPVLKTGIPSFPSNSCKGNSAQKMKNQKPVTTTVSKLQEKKAVTTSASKVHEKVAPHLTENVSHKKKENCLKLAPNKISDDLWNQQDQDKYITKKLGVHSTRASMLKSVPVLNSIAEIAEPDDSTTQTLNACEKDKKTVTPSRHSQRLQQLATGEENLGCTSALTPRRSLRLQNIPAKKCQFEGSILSPQPKINPRRSMRLIDLNTPDKEMSKSPVAKTNITTGFEWLTLMEPENVMDFSTELSKFEIDSKEYKFFKKVVEKLEPNCIRKSVKERQKEVHTKLCEVQQEYFQKYLLTNAIIKSAEEYKCQEANTEASGFVSTLYLNMAKRILPPEESQKPKLFGLSKDKVSNLYERQKSESKYAFFKKSIEDNINDFCKQLITCTGGMILPGEDWQNAFDRTMKDLEYKVIVSTREMKEQSKKKQLREMMKTYYEELSKGVSLLTKALLLTEDRLKFECDFSEMYHLRCHAVSLKLKCCKLKILQHTYDEETVPALKKISSHIYETEKKLNEDLYEKTAKLESYLKLGEDYAHLVEEYTDLMKSIKEQKWAIDELKARESQHGASSCN